MYYNESAVSQEGDGTFGGGRERGQTSCSIA